MKIDISSVLKFNDASLNIMFSEIVKDLQSIGEGFVFDNPVELKGSLFNIGGIVKMNGRIKTSYLAKCSRCLMDYENEIDIEITEEFVAEEFNSDDVYIYQGKSIEFDKVIKDNIILNLPTKQLCNDECKGLCEVCGCNLNEVNCECKKEEIDLRMQVLKNYFRE